MNYRKVVRSIVLAVCASVLIAASLTAASAAAKRYVNVTNGTPQAIGVTFTQAGASKAVAEGTVGKFDSKSFAMPDEFTMVKLSSVKGCTGSVVRDVPVGKNIVVRENCDVEVK